MTDIVAATDDSHAKSLIALSNAADGTFVQLWADPVTHRLLVDSAGGGGTGTVTSVSVVSANGFAGTVANPTTTPAITLSTSITGILSGNGTAISAASTTGSGAVVLATTPTITTPTISGLMTMGSALSPFTGTLLTLNNGTNNTFIGIGQGGSNQLFFGWNYNATAGTAYAQIATFSYANDLTIDAAHVDINVASGNPTLVGGTLAITGLATAPQIVTAVNAITATSNAATVPITRRISNITNSSAATLTITMTTTSAVDGQMVMVRIYDFSAVAQTLTWVNTENSTSNVPTVSNGSTTLPVTVGFQFNAGTSKWRCIGVS